MAMYDEVISAAESWLGYLEKKSNAQLEAITANAGSANYNIFAERYNALWNENLQAQPWCAIFVSVMLRQACGKEIVPHFASCSVGIRNFQAGKGGTWLTGAPARGDLIFFSDAKGAPAHVGFVSSVGKDTVVTIEGNTSGASGVVENGGGVCKKMYALNYSRIIGYGRPSYETDNDRAKVQARFGFDDDTMRYLDKHPYPAALYAKLAGSKS